MARPVITVRPQSALFKPQLDAALDYVEGVGGGGGGATNLTWTASTRTIASDTGTDAVITVADGSNAGLLAAADFTKLSGVATGATANSAADGTLSMPTARYEHEETIAATGVTAGKRVSVWLAPTVDADENAPEMTDLIAMSATPGSAQITVNASFSEPMSGPLKIQWSAF